MVFLKRILPMATALLLAPSLCFSETLHISEDVTLSGEFTQGGMIIGSVTPGSRVSLDGKSIRLTDSGDFVFGFGRDASNSSIITITLPNGKTLQKPLTISQREYKLQRIEGVPEKTVTPPPQALARIKKETAQVKTARKTNSNLLHFLSSFQWPLTGPITGVYGSQRIYNGVPKRPHYGLDIAAPIGTEVTAPANATVTLAHQNMFYSGGTLIMDHGYGISSTFIHLDEVLVKVGDQIKQGDIVAKVGSKGRSTGPHLDWRINWFDVRLDAGLITPVMPKESTP